MRSSLSLLVVFLLSQTVFAGDIDKAFKYLNTGDYPNAWKYLSEVAREEPENVAVNYGLAKYFSLKDNPAYHIDSANLFIKKAAAKLPLNPDDKQTKKYLTLGVRDFNIQSLQKSINRSGYEIAEEENTVESYQHFIDNFIDKGLVEKAENMRNQLAFVRARGKKDPAALDEFIRLYPNAREIKDAKELYDKLTYEQTTADGSYLSYKKYIDANPNGAYVKVAQAIFEEKILEHYNKKHDLNSYKEFIKNYPNSPARMQAEDSIYQLVTGSGSMEGYAEFVRNYKDNHRIKEAWDHLYMIYTAEASPDSYFKFKDEFHDFPDKERIQKDFELSKLDLKPFQKGDKWGYAVMPTLDSIAVIIPFEYEEAYDFHSGLAAVRLKPCTDRCTYFYIDKSDRRAFSPDFNYAGDFDNGFAIAGIGNCEEDSCLYGIINKSGNWVVQPTYSEMSEPTEGLYLIARNERYGYINRNGENIISPRYTDGTPFSEGVAAVALDSNWFFIDHTGTQLFFDGFKNVSSFHDSLAAATKDGIEWGYINKQGAWVISPLYESADDFENGFAIVSKRERDPKYKSLTTSVRYKIDKTGKVIEKLTAPKPEKSSTSKRRKK